MYLVRHLRICLSRENYCINVTSHSKGGAGGQLIRLFQAGRKEKRCKQKKAAPYRNWNLKAVMTAAVTEMRCTNPGSCDYPLCLSYSFMYSETVITVLQAVMSGYSAIVCVVSVFASFSDEVQKQANAACSVLLHTIS